MRDDTPLARAGFYYNAGPMRVRAKVVILSLLAVVLLVVLGGITAIGWQVVLGPKARPVTDRKFEVTQARLERGKYLVEGPAACFHCHSDHDLSQPNYPIIQAKKGAGWAMPIPELNNIAARNITPDPETGLGTWSDDEIARAIREGVRKDGTALFPVMPYMDFAKMDDADVEAIVVYLRTIPPVRNQVPARALPFPLEHIVKTMPTPITQPQPSHPAATPAQRGEYLVGIASCRECHSRSDQGQPVPGMAFGGGNLFPDLGQAGKSVFSVNITQDPSGIAHYDESLFIQTLRTGAVSTRTLSHIMPFEFFKNITDDDLRDMYAFLRTQPPVRHRINNTDPPTMCPICEQSHGLGNSNMKGN
jgi:mono/diheme cytochrome c family protein